VPQAAHVHVDEIGGWNEIVVLDLLEQHLAGQQLVGSLHHIFKQAKFARQELDLAAATFAVRSIRSSSKAPTRKLVGRILAGRRSKASKPGDELDERKRWVFADSCGCFYSKKCKKSLCG
jgi:hypothetical protein